MGWHIISNNNKMVHLKQRHVLDRIILTEQAAPDAAAVFEPYIMQNMEYIVHLHAILYFAYHSDRIISMWIRFYAF